MNQDRRRRERRRAMSPLGQLGVLKMDRLLPATAGGRIIGAQWEKALACEPGARGGEDPEDLHKMRVAIRRLRAARRVFRKALRQAAGGDALAPFDDDLRQVARALGAMRDLDVALDALRQYAATESTADQEALSRLAGDWQQRREAARVGLLATLDGEPMARLRERFAGIVATLVAPSAETAGSKRSQRLAASAPGLVRKALRRFRRRGRRLFVPTDAELHRFRIEAKRLRYTAEFLEPALGQGIRPLIQLITAIQEALGAVNDAGVAIAALLGDVERLASIPERAADTGAIARLIRHHCTRREAGLAQFRLAWPQVPKPAALVRGLRHAAPGHGRAAGPRKGDHSRHRALPYSQRS